MHCTAATDSDFVIYSTLNFTMSAMTSETVCFNISVLDDLLDENLEQFEFYFEILPNDYATVGDPSLLLVSIVDNDGEYSIISIPVYITCFLDCDTVPKVSWVVDQVTISEGEERDVCFSVSKTAQPHQIVVGVRGNQTAGKSFNDYW